MRGTGAAAGRGGGGAAGGRGGGGGWRNLEAANSAELTKLANDRIAQLIVAQQQTATTAAAGFGGARGGGGGGARYALGVRDAGAFDGSIPFLSQTATLLSFGRVDVPAKDGAWFNFNSGVSAKGRDAVKAMEAGNIVINLVDPSSKLLGDLLDATARPFLVTVTGNTPIDQSLIARMNQKNTLLLFECDPADAQGCVTRLQNYRKLFGDADNLVVSMRTNDRTEEAKKTIYLALIKSGWTKDQIYAVFGQTATPAAGGGRGGGAGNLSRLTPATGRGGQ